MFAVVKPEHLSFSSVLSTQDWCENSIIKATFWTTLFKREKIQNYLMGTAVDKKSRLRLTKFTFVKADN